MRLLSLSTLLLLFSLSLYGQRSRHYLSINTVSIAATVTKPVAVLPEFQALPIPNLVVQPLAGLQYGYQLTTRWQLTASYNRLRNEEAPNRTESWQTGYHYNHHQAALGARYHFRPATRLQPYAGAQALLFKAESSSEEGGGVAGYSRETQATYRGGGMAGLVGLRWQLPAGFYVEVETAVNVLRGELQALAIIHPTAGAEPQMAAKHAQGHTEIVVNPLNALRLGFRF